jgi:hypothetical protein
MKADSFAGRQRSTILKRGNGFHGRSCCQRITSVNAAAQPAEIAHHKIYLTAENVTDPDIALNPDNLEALCLELSQCGSISDRAAQRRRA